MHSSVITETCFLIRSQRTRSDIYVYPLLEETPFSAWPLALLKNPTFMWICVTNKSISTSYLHHNSRFMASLIAQLVKNLSAMQETPVQSWVRKFPWRRARLPTPVFLGFPGDTDSKESACNARDLGLIPGLGRSLAGGHSNPLQYSCLENPHGQRSLVGYRPWVAKSWTRLSN